MRTKLKLVLVLASLGLLAALAMSGPASAQTAGSFFEDPQDTNVPYVAWVGEKVRLVKCVDAARFHSSGWGDFNTVDWSGNPIFLPSYFPSNAQSRPSFAGAGEQAGRTCYDIVVASEKPGLAKIKLETRLSVGARNFTHDFLVIWMTMDAPALDELASNEIPGLVVGDPAGDGVFAPVDISPAPGFQGGFRDGYFQVDVTGSFPLGNNYAGDLPGDVAQLPRDWEALANLYGVSAAEAEDPSGWDIHDDQIDQVENRTADHSAASICGGTNLTGDEVDNCLGGSGIGAFSRLVGGTNPTKGPFDPLRPGTSYLPDGKVDAGDAPMPALRIDVGVSGAFGALAQADKHAIYSRNATGVADAAYPGNAHNLYAPFYAAYIPATRAPQTSSGITGEDANNFPGFFDVEYNEEAGLYHYWDLLNQANHPATNNTCLDVGGSGQFNGSGPISHPRGVASASVYTDEHGEAIVRFRPDVGIRLASDANNLCDIGEIGTTPRLLGTATISAQAELPFQQAQKPIDAAPLTKQLLHLGGKSLDCIAKSPIIAFCVETIRDIRGNPVAGAEVSFTREPRGLMTAASLKLGDFDTRGQTVVSQSDDEVRVRTNALGQAGVEVKSTLPGLVDLDAENVGTRNGGFGVQRVRCIRFAGDGVTPPSDSAFCVAPPAGTTPTPPNPVIPPGPTNQTNQTSQSVASTATIVSLAGTPVPATTPAAKPAAKAAALKLASARLVFKNGKRYLVVRVNGSAKTAKIRVTLVMRTGRATKPVVRTIATNRAVRVANLLVGKHVRTVRVTLAK